MITAVEPIGFDSNVHCPTPTSGVFPASVVEEIAQRSWSVPANATVGGAYNVMLVVAVEAAQVPAAGNEYMKVYKPAINPEAIAELLLVVVSVGKFGPEIKDQVPVDPAFPYSCTAVALQVPPAITLADAFSLTVITNSGDSC